MTTRKIRSPLKIKFAHHSPSGIPRDAMETTFSGSRLVGVEFRTAKMSIYDFMPINEYSGRLMDGLLIDRHFPCSRIGLPLFISNDI